MHVSLEGLYVQQVYSFSIYAKYSTAAVAGEEDEYFNFIIPEAYQELEKWRQYRIRAGETVTNESWVMRNTWNTKKGYTRGLVSAPIKLQAGGVKRLVEDALWTQGLRRRLEHGQKRHEFQD